MVKVEAVVIRERVETVIDGLALGRRGRRTRSPVGQGLRSGPKLPRNRLGAVLECHTP